MSDKNLNCATEEDQEDFNKLVDFAEEMVAMHHYEEDEEDAVMHGGDED